MRCRQHSISESTQKARRGRIEVISYMVKIFPVMLHQHMMWLLLMMPYRSQE